MSLYECVLELLGCLHLLIVSLNGCEGNPEYRKYIQKDKKTQLTSIHVHFRKNYYSGEIY